jgi:hypothetical protein
MRSRSAILAFALALAAPFVHAQTAVGPSNCGSATSAPLQCNEAPVGPWHTDEAGVLVPFGSLWLHDYLTGTGPDYIIWQGGYENLPEAVITKSVCVTTTTVTSAGHTANQCTFLVTYFHGGDPAIASYYTGEGTFHFTYSYSGSGSTARWIRKLTAGALTLYYY